MATNCQRFHLSTPLINLAESKCEIHIEIDRLIGGY